MKKKELADCLSNGISISELIWQVADEFWMKVEDIKRRSKNMVLGDVRGGGELFCGSGNGV